MATKLGRVLTSGRSFTKEALKSSPTSCLVLKASDREASLCSYIALIRRFFKFKDDDDDHLFELFIVHGYLKRSKLSEETINPDINANSHFTEEIPKFCNHLGADFQNLRNEIIKT